jgi:hypothetical protein
MGVNKDLTRNNKYAYTINTCQCKPQQIEESKSVRCLNQMSVNKNISIFMLFDCVQINTGLGFH